jgi:eukaryotic-like serine/threonine-protein kinase
MAAAVDDWAGIRAGFRKDTAGAARLIEVARVADPDPWRKELRATLKRPDKAARLAGLRALAGTAKFDELGPISLLLLGMPLAAAGDYPAAEAVLRKAQVRHPHDVWVNYDLAQILEQLSRRDEAIRFYTAARSIRPETAHELAHALEERGQEDEAVAIFRDLRERRPGNPRHLLCLGRGLKRKGLAREADEALEAAVVAGRRAIQLNPDSADAHIHLGLALKDQGKLDDAIAEFRQAIRINPGYAVAHVNIGGVLVIQGKVDDAIAEYRQAIRLKPDYADSHYGLGLVLKDQGKLDDAVAEYRDAIRLKPDFAVAHNNLGAALHHQGRFDDAVAEYREAIRLKPDFAHAYNNLATILASRGDYAGSLEMYRKGHELGSKQPGWDQPSAQWVAAAERALALSQRLPAVLRGEDKPKDGAECLAFAQLAYHDKKFATATRLWSDALQADPKLGDDRQARHRYNAACAASLAATGQGKDDPSPDEAARAKLREQAMGWLKAELAAWTKLLESGPPQARAFIVQTLNHWKQDTDLAGIRDAEALAKLPEAERKEWQALWAEVEALLAQASAK